MLKRITASLLSTILLFALLIPLCSAESVILLKGDANLDGKITVEDARAVLRMSLNAQSCPAPESADFLRLKFSKKDSTRLTISDARLILRAAIRLDDYNSYYSKEELTDMYNQTANRVKSDSFRQTTKMSEYTITKTNDTGSNSTGSDRSIFSSTEDIPIQNDNYPLFGCDFVSALTSDDIKSISLDIYGKKKILSAFGDNASKIPWDGNCEDFVVIHIKTIEGKLSTIRKKSTDYVASFKKAYNTDILPETQTEYNESDILTAEPRLKYNEIKVNISVDYICKYSSDFSSLVPIGAIYNAKTVSDYSISYYLSIPGQTPVKQTETGKATEDKTTLYLFNRYLP